MINLHPIEAPIIFSFLVHALSSIVHSTEASNVLLEGPLALQLHPYECFPWINFHKKIFLILNVSCHLAVDLRLETSVL